MDQKKRDTIMARLGFVPDVLTVDQFEALTVNADGSIEYPLFFPVSVGKGDALRTISEVTVRRPKGKHLRNLDLQMGAAQIGLQRTEQLTGLTAPEINELDELDISAIGDVMESFSVPGRGTGKPA